VEVDEHLRVVGAPNVFATGDVTAVPEPKRSKAATEHAVTVAANIRAPAAGRPVEQTYRPGRDAVLVPLGSTGGASQVPGPDGPVLLGAAETSGYKGADLLLGQFGELFGVSVRPSRSGTFMAPASRTSPASTCSSNRHPYEAHPAGRPRTSSPSTTGWAAADP
jgi:hypothetical protein